MSKRKLICPKCGSSNGVKIVYGYPSAETLEKAELGEISLGGCCVSFDDPTSSCKDCDYRWGGKQIELLAEMQSIKASIGGYFGPSYFIEADAARGIVIHRCVVDGFDEAELPVTRSFTTGEWSKLIKGLMSCDFIDWLDQYENNHVLDGTNWHVEVGFDSGNSIVKYGSNEYPGRWKQFCRLLSTFAGRKFA
jgi:hypothetical protein